MNPAWFGDSYDIVKRFFVEQLHALGYKVSVDPMLTGDWNGSEDDFYRFLGTNAQGLSGSTRSALLLDPDTGIGANRSSKHVTIREIVEKLSEQEIVVCFDQSFSRNRSTEEQMQEKLSYLIESGKVGFYYDSHARFLFASSSRASLERVKNQLLKSGLPKRRIVE